MGNVCLSASRTTQHLHTPDYIATSTAAQNTASVNEAEAEHVSESLTATKKEDFRPHLLHLLH
ncbi:hypothetical protein SAMN05216597_0370 [Pseudomonas cannabina]|nr:hypothetical protein SAMN05216597_0370 [Pseudomonas cannabina]